MLWLAETFSVSHETLQFCFFFCVFFPVSLRVHGSAYRLDFIKSQSPSVFRPVRKENDFASTDPEKESNSSYTAQIDPFQSALSTRSYAPSPYMIYVKQITWKILLVAKWFFV